MNELKFLPGLLLALLTCGSIKSQVSVYFAAHEDDWQLFMGIDAYNDLQALPSNLSSRVVFIYTCAGDAGTGMNNGYVVSRENCAMNSLRLATSPASSNNPPGMPYSSIVNVNGHNILTRIYGNVVSYFLRLPDGCSSGPTGCYPSTTPSSVTCQSLWHLYVGGINFMARDGSTTYSNWADLVQTIRVIMAQQCNLAAANGFGQPWVHCPDFNTTYNPGDHADHLYTGKLAEQASDQCCMYFSSYVDYATGTMNVNLSNDQIETEAGLYGACSLGLADGGWANNLEAWHKQFLDKNYYRNWHNTCIGNPPPQRTVITNTDSGISAEEVFVMYPQPAKDKLNVSYTVDGVSQTVAKIEIEDIVGKHTAKRAEEQNFIDISDLKPGIYFARITAKSNHFILKKFMKE